MNQSIVLNLEQIDEDRALLQIATAQGQESRQFTLPWLDRQEWNAVFWYLTAFSQYPTTWPADAETIKSAIELQLATNDTTPAPDRIERIGRQLYGALFSDGPCEQLFQRALHSVAGGPPLVELHFSEAGHYLQTYPWELLHDGEDFLFDSLRATLVRYVKFGKPVQSIKLTDTLKVLLVDPRPTMPANYGALTRSDRATLRAFFAEADDRLQLEELDTAIDGSTFAKLITALNKSYPVDIHVIHIDAHGEFNPKETAAPQRPPQGQIAFSDSKNNLEWISGHKLGKALVNRGIQLIVLSTCGSGTTGGGSVFNSVAGALIRQGIPAVVAMQFPVEEDSTRVFIQSLYQTLLNGAPLVQAVAAARTSLLAIDDAWYRPALYLRTDPANMAGKIFEAPGYLQQGSTEEDVTGAHTPRSPSLQIPQALPKINLTTVRRSLNLAFDDPGLDAFCQDYFPAVFDRFSRGMRKDEKITLLLDHCRRTPKGFELLRQAALSTYEMSEFQRDEFKALADQIAALLEVQSTEAIDQVTIIQAAPQLSGFKQVKLKGLEDRLETLTRQYKAANRQLNSAMAAVDKITIQHQIKDLEQEIQVVEDEINQLRSSST